MTKPQKRLHAEGLERSAADLRRLGDRRGAELLERAASEFRDAHLRPKKRRTVTWS